jgi:hypothetical protein
MVKQYDHDYIYHYQTRIISTLHIYPNHHPQPHQRHRSRADTKLKAYIAKHGDLETLLEEALGGTLELTNPILSLSIICEDD